MKIELTTDEFKRLVNARLIKIKSADQYQLELYSPIVDEKILVDVDLNLVSKNTTATNLSKINAPLGVVEPKRIVDCYEELYNLFPITNAIDDLFPITRAMRGGSKDINLQRYRKILNEHKIAHNDVMEALRYELWYRKKNSMLEGKNHMNFMKNLDSWLLNVSNIEANSLLSKSDKDYQNQLNNQSSNEYRLL